MAIDNRSAAEDDLLSPLPAEVVALIVDQLSQPDLTSCLRVNSFFCSLALPPLYQYVRLSECGPWPGFEDVPDAPRPAFLERGALTRRVRRLDIVPHSTEQCQSECLHESAWSCHGLPHLPRLQVLRLFLERTWSGARVFHTNVDPGDAQRRPCRPCAALPNIRPHTLVVRGLSLAHNTFPHYEVPRELEQAVRRYVCVFEPDTPYFLPWNAEWVARSASADFRQRLPANASELVLVFWPPGRSRSWRLKDTQTLSWDLIWLYAEGLFTNLAEWLASAGDIPHQRLVLKIVNVGALVRVEGDRRPTEAEAEAMMRARVVDVVSDWVDMRRFAPESGVKERVLDSLEFLSMQEYIETQDWRNVFDPCDLAAWREDDCAKHSKKAVEARKMPSVAPTIAVPQIAITAPPAPPVFVIDGPSDD